MTGNAWGHLARVARWVPALAASAFTLSIFVRPIPGHSVFWDDWVNTGVLWAAGAVCLWGALRGSRLRAAMVLLAAAIFVYTLGSTAWVLWVQPMADAPYPSVADYLWLAFYPMCALVILLMARGHTGHSILHWVDGLVGALAIAAVGVLISLGPIAHNVTGSTWAIIVNMAYPVGDLALFMLLISLSAASRHRPSCAWVLLGACLAVWAIADTTYVFQVAAGTYAAGTLLDAGWLVPTVAMAWVPWLVESRPLRTGVEPAEPLRPRTALFLPAGLAAVCLGLLTWKALDEVPVFAVLAAAALAAAGLRLVLSVTEVERLARVETEARTDPLTGLGNRRRLAETLTRKLLDDAQFTLLLMDLDGFKDVNDTLGHQAGDLCLQTIGRRMSDCVRGDDVLFRLGGDEFAVIAESAPGGEPQLLVDRLMEEIKKPISIGDDVVAVGVSIGLVTCPDQANSASDALRYADIAMYHAKRRGLGGAHYDPDLEVANQRRLTLAMQLRQALNAGAFDVVYQPIVDIATGRPRRVEALIRWRHPELGVLLPGSFLDVVIEAGQQEALTRFVLDTAVAQQRRWLDEGLDLPVSVNITAVDLGMYHLADLIQETLTRHGVPGEQLGIELTEQMLMRDQERSHAQLVQIRSLGVHIALDDFGTGFASLNHLRDLPLNEVKIDQAFIAALPHDPIARTIIEQTIHLAAKLGLRVVAEGVEDHGLRQELLALGCDTAQGFLWSEALAPAAVSEWVAEGTSPVDVTRP